MEVHFMELFEAITSRRSVRDFKADAVPTELADKIAFAGSCAASGMNRQSPIILEISNKELRDRLSKMNAAVMGADKDPFYGAPTVLVVLADRNVPTHIYDGSLVMGNMMLAANALGLGSCWIHRAKEVFDTDEGKAILKDLGVEGDYEGIGNLAIGYVNGAYPATKARKENYIFKAE